MLSIKFPDLQVLFPRAHDTSRAEQLNQKQADISQAQVAAAVGEETIIKRRQVTHTEKQTHGRIGERETKDHRQPENKEKKEEKELADEDKAIAQGNLGQRIDIRI